MEDMLTLFRCIQKAAPLIGCRQRSGCRHSTCQSTCSSSEFSAVAVVGVVVVGEIGDAYSPGR